MKERSRPPLMPIVGRLIMLATVLLVASCGAASMYSLGYTWLYDSETGLLPILQCPNFIMNMGAATIDGPRCVVRINYSMINYLAIAHRGNLDYCDVDTNSKIDCRLRSSCDDAIQSLDEDGMTCEAIFPGSENVPFLCSDVKPVPFCDSKFRVTPGNLVAIRGLFAGTAVVLLIWFIAELMLWSVEFDLAKEDAVGFARQAKALPELKAANRKYLEDKWKAESQRYRHGTRHGYSARNGSTIGGGFSPASADSLNIPPSFDRHQMMLNTCGMRTSIQSRDPATRFSCAAWKRKLAQWRQLRAGNSSTFRPLQIARTVGLTMFFQVLLALSMFMIILGSPRNLVNRGSIPNVIYGSISIWNIHSWLDALIFTDVILDFGLFLCACLTVAWPSEPVFASHLKSRLEELQKEQQAAVDVEAGASNNSESLFLGSETMTESSGGSLVSILNHTLTQDVCLLIACHKSTLTEEKEESFRNTILSALRVFPPKHIFVCDNGSSLFPLDATESVVKSIHEEINYLYIPEGNKTFAFYWANHYWIPFLEREGRIPVFRYALIIDDDVPLPANLHIPHEHLKQLPDIKAVHFAITAAAPDGKGNLLVQSQDIEYKLSGVHKYFQSYLSRALSCHGAISLWERRALDQVLFEHDTVFHGEDLYMGLALLRKRDGSRIISCPQTIVPTYCPSSWAVLFRQRVKSWELTSHKKTFTYLIELLSPESFMHNASLVLKPYFLQELLAIILDWLRIYLLLGLIFRDWLALAIMTGCFMSILYLQVALFQLVYLRKRKDLRATFKSSLCFPLYKLSSLVFRVCALCQNILVYSHYRKGVHIKTREDEIKDIPPVPPHPDPDWFTIWLVD